MSATKAKEKQEDKIDVREYYAKQLVSGKGKRILDIGCSKGELVQELIKDGHRVVGLERNKDLVGYCRSRGLEVYECDVEKDLSVLGDKKFDYIMLVDVINHFIHPQNTLHELSKHLDKNSRFIITVPHIMWLPWRILYLAGVTPTPLTSPSLDDYHYHFFNVDLLSRLLDSAGLRIEAFNSYSKIPLMEYHFKVAGVHMLACNIVCRAAKK